MSHKRRTEVIHGEVLGRIVRRSANLQLLKTWHAAKHNGTVGCVLTRQRETAT